MKKGDELQDSLIGMMVEETFEQSGSDQVKDEVDLGNYFEARISFATKKQDDSVFHFLNSYQLKHLTFQYKEGTGCFRVRKGKLCLDFPSNWSIFQAFSELSQNNYLIVSALENNDDFLCELFAGILPGATNFVFCHSPTGVPTLFGFDSENKQAIEILSGIFTPITLEQQEFPQAA